MQIVSSVFLFTYNHVEDQTIWCYMIGLSVSFILSCIQNFCVSILSIHQNTCTLFIIYILFKESVEALVVRTLFQLSPGSNECEHVRLLSWRSPSMLISHILLSFSNKCNLKKYAFTKNNCK